MGWGIWTQIFHNTWCIWTGITNICREFDLTKTSKSKFPGECRGGGDVKVSIWFAHKTNRTVARPIIGGGGGASYGPENKFLCLLPVRGSHNVYYVYIKCCKHLNYKFPRVH
jgi:hypothetical protein